MDLNRVVRSQEAAELVGISKQTLLKAVREGRVRSHQRVGSNQNLFVVRDLLQYAGRTEERSSRSAPERVVGYARVSGTSGQDTSLDDQERTLRSHYPGIIKVVKDKGSGLSAKRKGLERVLTLAEERKIDAVAVVCEDRLARFGVPWIRRLLAAYDVRLIVLRERQSGSPHEELMADLMSLIASFSGRFYKLRSIENQRRVLALAETALAGKGEA